MTAGTSNEGPPQEKAAPAKGGYFGNGLGRNGRLTKRARRVNRKTVSQQLSHADWLRRQGAYAELGRHMIAMQIALRRPELGGGAV